MKNNLELENMSGRREVTVLQDFQATLFLANMLASLQWQTDSVIEENANPDNKNEQTTNEKRLIRKFRNRFIACLLRNEFQKV